MAIDTNIAEEEVRLPRQVSTANIISDQPAGDIFNFVETYFLKWVGRPGLRSYDYVQRVLCWLTELCFDGIQFFDKIAIPHDMIVQSIT